MNKKLLEILVCPFDKESELELYEFKTKSLGNDVNSDLNISLNSITSNQKSKGDTSKQIIHSNHEHHRKEDDTQNSKSSLLNSIVVEGLLLCKKCLRFYPIIEEIPIILPDELRDKTRDLEMLNRWVEFIPKNILENLKPWTIKNNN